MNRLESDLKGEATVLHVDLLSETGQAVVRRYGARALPTIFVFDGCGTPVASFSGIPNPDAVTEAVRMVAACDPG